MAKAKINNVTLEPLMDNMREVLQVYNNEKVEITNETIHNTVLADDDGFRTAPSSMSQYRNYVRWIVWVNGGKDYRNPAGWMDMSVRQLAEFIMSKQT